MRNLVLASVLVGLGLSTSAVHAEIMVGHSAGLKVLAGADTWSKPSNAPSAGLGFIDTAGGFGYGLVGYYELRLIKFIGLEADLAYQHGPFHRKVTVNGTYDFTETVTTNGFRIPLLAKLNIPLGLGRFWLGAGPEFTISQSSSAKLEQTGGPSAGAQGTETTRNVKPIFGTAGLGLVIELPLVGLEIPLELRASKNLSQPSDYSERVSADLATSTLTIRAESSWVYRLGAGVGYQF